MKESLNVEGLRPVDIVNEKEDTEVKSKLLGMGSYLAKFYRAHTWSCAIGTPNFVIRTRVRNV